MQNYLVYSLSIQWHGISSAIKRLWMSHWIVSFWLKFYAFRIRQLLVGSVSLVVWPTWLLSSKESSWYQFCTLIRLQFGRLPFPVVIAWCCQPRRMGHGQHLNLLSTWIDGFYEIDIVELLHLWIIICQLNITTFNLSLINSAQNHYTKCYGRSKNPYEKSGALGAGNPEASMI